MVTIEGASSWVSVPQISGSWKKAARVGLTSHQENTKESSSNTNNILVVTIF